MLGRAEGITQRGDSSHPRELSLDRRRVPTRPLSMGRYAFLFSQGLKALHGLRDGGPVASPDVASRRP
jgi:hypothetical protein